MAGRGGVVAVLQPLGLGMGLLFLLRKYYQRKFPSPEGAPFVPGHWFFGNLFEVLQCIANHSLNDWWVENHEKLGRKTAVACLIGQPKIVNTIDPRNVEHMLKTRFSNYVKGDWFRDRLSDLLGNGIFNVDGDAWMVQRKVSSHMFTHNQFKGHIWNVVGANCAHLVKLLRETPDGEVVDVFNFMNRFTLDTIGSIGFARDIGSLDNPESPFLKSFDRAQQISILRFMLPLWQVRRALGIGEEREASHHFKVLSEFALETVELLKEECAGGKGDSFVGLFVQEAQKTGQPIDDLFLKDMVLNFLIAGRDTTANSLSWIFWLLMGHPEVEEKILKEMDEVLSDGPLTYDKCSKLKYLQNVIHEGLRLYPSVPQDSKVAIEDDTLPDGTFIPGGCVLQFHPYAMGRCKDLWGDDAAQFRPERWEGREFPSSFTYSVFNAGPRECLGKRLAWVEMRACLAEVIRNVKFELAVPRDSIKYDMQLTIGMSSGLPCRISPR